MIEPKDRLAAARQAAGYDSPTDAARAFGFNEISYRAHEAGGRGLSRVAKRYAKAFRVSEAWLLTGEGDGEHIDPDDVRAALEVIADKLGMGRASVQVVADLLLQAIRGRKEVPFGLSRADVVRKEVSDALHKFSPEAKPKNAARKSP